MNAICITVLTNVACFMVVLTKPEYREPFLVGVCAFIAYSCCYLLMWAKKQLLARITLLVTGMIVIYFVSSYITEEGYLQVLFFSISGVALIIFDWNEWKYAAAFGVLPILLYIVGEATHFYLPGVSPFPGTLPLEAIRFFSILGAFINVAGGMLYFRRQIKQHQLQIKAYIARIQEEQQAQIQAHKMASLGEMAGAMAHEINSPLTTIVFRIKLLQQALGKAPLEEKTRADISAHAEKIHNTTMRIAAIIGALQTISHSGENESFVSTDISGIARDTVALCAQRFRSAQVDLQVEIPATLQVECRPGQIGQILLNLLNNAFDAAKDSQVEHWVRITAREVGASVEIQVTDSGAPIPRGIQERLFEPFFTTKRPGRGTGLGLSISRAIALEHQGSLEYLPSEEHSSFLLILPIRHST